MSNTLPQWKLRAIVRALEAEWLTNAEIAEELGVDVGTVDDVGASLRAGARRTSFAKRVAAAIGVR